KRKTDDQKPPKHTSSLARDHHARTPGLLNEAYTLFTKAFTILQQATLDDWRKQRVACTQKKTKHLDEDDDVVVLENSETKEEDVKEDEFDHNKERYTFEDDDDDVEFDDLD
nr:hypothetical protein [Tanacetum cinerariifolium]